jgi:hypothetical protein
MLIRNYIILVFWIDRLVVRRNVDLVIWELVFAEIFEEVGVKQVVEVYVSVVGVFGLGMLAGHRKKRR